jgi:hypothetical protein
MNKCIDRDATGLPSSLDGVRPRYRNYIIRREILADRRAYESRQLLSGLRSGAFPWLSAVCDVHGYLHDLLGDNWSVSSLDPQRHDQGLHLRSEFVLIEDLADAVALARCGRRHSGINEHRGEFALLG